MSKLSRFGWGTMAILFLLTFVAGALGVLISALHNNSTQSQTQNQSQTQASRLIGTKLANFTPIAHINTLQAINIKVGTGATVQLGDTVTVLYSGAVAATGKIFDSNMDTNQPAQLSLGQVIPGWTDGIPGMKVGGTRRLLIPAAAGYGANPPAGSSIPTNADLVFDITLLATQRANP